MSKKKNKKLLAPTFTMLLLILIAVIASVVLSLLNVDGSKTSIVNGTLETSIVVVRNVLSKEGIRNFFSNIITNFNLLQPLLYLILSLMAVSIAKSSGILKHIALKLRKINPKVLTFFVILLSIISSIAGDYSYIILLPLIAALYQYLGRSPVLGIITVFLGITLGYGTSLFYNYNDYALGVLTQNAANNISASYRYTLYCNHYIMIASTFIMSYLLTLLVEYYLSKKVVTSEPYSDEIKTSRKALTLSFITFVILLVGIAFLIIPTFGGILLDTTQTTYVAKLLSPTSPFYESFIFIFLVLSALVSFVYGFVSKNFENNLDYGWGFSKQFDNLGYLFILMFLSSILIGIIDWSNLGVVLANKLIGLLNIFNFTGIPLIIVAFLFIIIMSILLPNSLEKWILISPVMIPLFMKGNLTPDFAQFVFKAADSVGKVLTPVFLYFPIMVGFIQKYNSKENKITLFGTFKLIWPIIIIMVIFWLLLLILWYVASLPLGIGTYATL